MHDKTLERFVSIDEQVEFCRVHKLEFKYKKEARENGYPMDINFYLLRKRVSQHTPTMLQIVQGTLKSKFREDEETFINNNDKAYSRSVKGRLV